MQTFTDFFTYKRQKYLIEKLHLSWQFSFNTFK